MKTEILRTDGLEDRRNAVATSVRLLRQGEAIALPTETVYGLAADALNADAVLKIFEAKERPYFDPLIVHLPDPDWLPRVAAIEAANTEVVRRLIERFWPGPLTLVLPRTSIVPDLVTAGLNTVAVRISAHPVFAETVTAFNGPLAAPSANRFGRISPTAAEHVATELDGRIPLIVDAGFTTHGLESTIIAVESGTIELLRLGPVTSEQLLEFAEVRSARETAGVVAPGQLPSHYAPRTPLVIAEDLRFFDVPRGPRVAALAWRSVSGRAFAEVRTLSQSGDLREAARNLFRYMRELDESRPDLIVAERVPEVGLGAAIMDRLRRAAAASSGAPGKLARTL